MTRDEAKAVLDNLDIVRHYASGGDLEWRIHDAWHHSSRLTLCCLHTGNYRAIKGRKKPRFKLQLDGVIGKP